MATIPYGQEAQASAAYEAQNAGALAAGGMPQETASGNFQIRGPGGTTTAVTPISQALASYQSSLNQGNAAISQSQQLLQQNQALLAQLANKPVAPTLNYNAIQSSAAAAAKAQVNPLYTQYLNQYLQNEAATTQQQQQANQLAIQSAQSAQQNTLAQNQQQQEFTGQNTALNIGNINQQTANRQQNEGMNYDEQRAQLEQQIGQSNLGASGIGQQQIWTARNKLNVQELQAQDSDQFNRNQQLLNESNTFAQISQSNKYATTKEGEAESKANLDLSSYLQQAAYNQNIAEEKLTAWQEQATYAAQQNNIASQVSQQLAGLKGGVQGAASAAWAPFLQTAAMPEVPTLQ